VRCRSYLALGCKDQHIAWFDPDSGTLLRIVSLRGVPADIRAYAHPDGKQLLMSASVGRRSLLVWQLPLAVQPGERGHASDHLVCSVGAAATADSCRCGWVAECVLPLLLSTRLEVKLFACVKT
jgi:hypothetical protein